MTHLTRRTLIKGAVWSVPAVTVAVSAPAAAASDPSTGTLALGQEWYSTGSFYGGSFQVTGVFTLVSGSTYPSGEQVSVEFEDPEPFSLDGQITVEPSDGTLSFTVVFAPDRPAWFSDTQMTVSAPGFTAAAATVWVPEPD